MMKHRKLVKLGRGGCGAFKISESCTCTFDMLTFSQKEPVTHKSNVLFAEERHHGQVEESHSHNNRYQQEEHLLDVTYTKYKSDRD